MNLIAAFEHLHTCDGFLTLILQLASMVRTWRSRRAIRHLFYRHVTRSRTRCSNAFLTAATKRTYVSSRRAISLGSLFHRPRLLRDGNYTVGSEKPLAKYTSAVCDRGKNKTPLYKLIPATVLMRKAGMCHATCG